MARRRRLCVLAVLRECAELVEVRDLPNVLMLHFASLKRDLSGEIGRVASFLEVPIDEARFPESSSIAASTI
jgi:Sulfotransferase domain